MTGTLVFTGPTGPASTVTALSLTGLRNIEFDFTAQVVKTTDEFGRVKSFDIHATTTFTASITTGVLVTETLSQ